MVTRNKTGSRVTIPWRELNDLLSKAEVLHPEEEITNLTLANPKTLLIDVSFPKPKVVKPESRKVMPVTLHTDDQ